MFFFGFFCGFYRCGSAAFSDFSRGAGQDLNVTRSVQVSHPPLFGKRGGYGRTFSNPPPQRAQARCLRNLKDSIAQGRI
ncbi:MAG: hypothetical protein Greene041679_21 [Parcubacteria group bacterium Greene0416_79]|nr:MAG: hypothetical protein Greene041679_21 [Parcubacteria group bacterium Greene0416_79]